MYGKLFASLYQGTLRGRANEILVFTNLIAHADRDGFVDKHWRAISEEVGLSVDDVKCACAALEAPDPESRTPDQGGARIERMDDHRAWGWRIVNYAKYREIKSAEERRVQNRAAQQRRRSADVSNCHHASATVITRHHASAVVSTGQQPSAVSAHVDAEVEAEAKDNTCADAPSAGLVPEGFAEFWELYPRKSDRKRAMSAWKHIPLKEHAAIMANVAGRMRSDESWTKDGGKFIPHPTTYLNGRRWEDEFQSKIEMVPAKDAKPVKPNSQLTDEELWVRTGSSSMMSLESFVEGVQPGGPFHYLRHETHAPASQRDRPL